MSTTWQHNSVRTNSLVTLNISKPITIETIIASQTGTKRITINDLQLFISLQMELEKKEKKKKQTDGREDSGIHCNKTHRLQVFGFFCTLKTISKVDTTSGPRPNNPRHPNVFSMGRRTVSALGTGAWRCIILGISPLHTD